MASKRSEITIEQMEAHPIGKVLLDAFSLALKKNQDYASKEDIFKNFRGSLRMGVKNSTGVAIRLGDKWSRFENGVNRGWAMGVENEGMVDTTLDIINYSAIYQLMYLEEQDF